MPRKTGLGKGLSALIPDTPVEWTDERDASAPAVQVGVAELPVNAIVPNRTSRTAMDEAALRGFRFDPRAGCSRSSSRKAPAVTS
jgi:hypothetical protein